MALLETHSGKHWLVDQLTAEQLGALLGLHGVCIADIDTYERGGLRLFCAVLRANEGLPGAWYFGQTGPDVGARLTEQGAVPLTLASYPTPQGVRYAVSMQKRPKQTYWWYFGLTADELGARLGDHDAVPVDITACPTPDGLRFAAILVPREGQSAWWYFGQTPQDIAARLAETGGRLRSVRAYATSDGPRHVVSITSRDVAGAGWYFGQTLDDLQRLTRQTGGFVTDLSTYVEQGNRRFMGLLRPRPWPMQDARAHASVRAQLGASHTGGWHGFYLRRLGGPVLQAFNEDVPFDPCSTLKLLVHAHAVKAVQDGRMVDGERVTLSTVIDTPPGEAENCPFVLEEPHQRMPRPLGEVLRLMMQASANAAPEALRHFFGKDAVAATAATLGMPDTRHTGPTGCENANTGTLVDFGRLLERCSTDFLDAAHWAVFRAHALDAPLPEVVDVCRARAAETALPADFADRYRGHMLSVCKPGNGSDGRIAKQAIAGYVALPFCEGGRIAHRQYVYGLFIDHAAHGSIRDPGFNRLAAELLGDEVAASVASFARGDCLP